MQTPVETLRSRLEAAGQEHVLRWWGDLDEAGRSRLLGQIESLDLDWVAQTAQRLRDGSLALSLPQGLTPIDAAGNAGEKEDLSAWADSGQGARPLRSKTAEARAAGEALLREGKAAALVVAGGQGTRLGFSAPKGCLPIGPVSGRSLFQLHAESVLAAARRWGRPVPFCVMTSEATDGPTRAFFEEHKWFGLPPQDVLFFCQAMLPALSPEGKLVLEEKDRLLMSPDGHGGLYAALRQAGALDELVRRGIEEVSYFQVDNPLVRQVDPVFLGAHRLARAEMSCKALRKRSPDEGLGVFGLTKGRLRIVEYSDMPHEAQERRREDGALAFGLGSPAIHVFGVAFIRRMLDRLDEMPLHVAAKASPCLDDAGQKRPPQGKNVRKFEKFVFDALPLAERWLVMETRREDEFAPVKNREGEDSPDTARLAMAERWARWLEAAGCAVPRDASGCPAVRIEISPLFALDEEQLRGKLRPGFRVEGDVLLD